MSPSPSSPPPSAPPLCPDLARALPNLGTSPPAPPNLAGVTEPIMAELSSPAPPSPPEQPEASHTLPY
eukprot:940176-Prymnesium_polylepis.1